jgi:PAS domain-containing protein
MDLAFGQGWLRWAVIVIGAVFASVGLYGLLTLIPPVTIVHLATTSMPLLAGVLMIGGAWRWSRLLLAAAVCLDIEAVLAGAVGSNGTALSMVLPLIGLGIVQPIAGRRTNIAAYVLGGIAAFAGYVAALFYGPAASLPKVAPVPVLLLIVGGAIALALAVNWQAGALLRAAIAEAGRELLVRRALDDELRSTNDRLEAVLSAAPLAIASVDGDGIVRFWNAAAEGIFGWPADKAIGGSLAEVAGIASAELAGLLGHTRAGGGSWQVPGSPVDRRVAATSICACSWRRCGAREVARRARRSSSRTSPSGRCSRTSCARPRRWRRWVSLPAASPMTSTTC